MGQTEGVGRSVWTLAETHPARGARAFAALFAFGLVAVSLAGMAGAARREPVVSGVVTASAVVIALADVLTGYLLWVQARVIQAYGLALLGGVYVGTSLLVAGNALLFHRTGANGAAWLWICWHVYFTGGVIAYVLAGPPRDRAAHTGLARTRRAFAAAIAVAVVAFALVGTGVSPAVMQGATLALPAFGVTLLCLWTLAAVAVLAVRQRAGTVLDLWLLVTMVGTLCDLGLVFAGHVRYDYGWYVARFLSLIAALIVLGALFYEMNRIYVRLLRAQERMAHAHVGLLAANTRLSLLLDQDELTEVLSRRGVLRMLQELLAGAAQTPAVLMVDLDHFKVINDRLGHLGGDEVLRKVSRRIKAALRATDVVGRYGGDEFVVVLPTATAQDAWRVAEKIVRSLREQPVRVGAGEVTVTISIGLASAQPKDSAEDLLRRADEALYRAKDRGRDHIAEAAPA
ncbi:MAG: sensor domain-containing diguanylate cyclase [Gammaproteobacteria bacterium]|nr:sensor domain-containing diguanylate cyclase [Gammaproteobacteria bacterium]